MVAHACPTRAPGDTARMHSVPDTYVFPNPCQPEGHKTELTQNKKPVQYRSTVEAMVGNDYLSFDLADVYQKSEGWMESHVAADAEGSYTFYAKWRASLLHTIH
ncbi:hypothetical protein EDB83DRAFT_2521178 [Lactarius deliciosus]|nr:hypothetical protein EDB83DRAFT_2521178 [Lactarius deliciosus]